MEPVPGTEDVSHVSRGIFSPYRPCDHCLTRHGDKALEASKGSSPGRLLRGSHDSKGRQEFSHPEEFPESPMPLAPCHLLEWRYWAGSICGQRGIEKSPALTTKKWLDLLEPQSPPCQTRDPDPCHWVLISKPSPRSDKLFLEWHGCMTITM